jgi:hypothetical protein
MVTVTYSQDRFLKAYYVTDSNDTIVGFSHYLSSYEQAFLFRERLHAPAREVDIQHVKRLQFDAGPTFVRLTDPNNKLINKKLGQIKVDGVHDLVEQGHRLYFASREGRVFEIKPDKGDIATNARNRAFLDVLFNECPEVANYARSAPLNEKTLTSMAVDFTACKGEKAIVTKYKGKRRVDIGFTAGMSTVTYNIKVGLDQYYLNEIKYPASTSANVGIAMIIHTRTPSPVVSFPIEISTYSAKFSGSYEETSDDDRFGDLAEKVELKIDLRFMEVRSGIRITSRSNIINPFFSAGLLVMTTIRNDSGYTRYVKVNDFEEWSDGKFPETVSGIGAWASVGLARRFGGSTLSADLMFSQPYVTDADMRCITPRIAFTF